MGCELIDVFWINKSKFKNFIKTKKVIILN